MRGVYEASVKISALAAAKTLMYLTAPSTKCIEILSAAVTNLTNETNEQCECTLHKVSSLGTPTATTLTPTKLEQGDQAAASTVKGDVTASEPTYTSAPNVEVGRSGFASLAGWFYQPVPEERLIITPAETWGLRILNAPTAFDAMIRVTFREIG